ncbi:hypothetical protein V5R04_06840 [Jonesiaceae bacterium BS-20]|uniref:Uncharacterized protein n=1 Tax=Jonesiaceae bacterium BS-20 TaxID=3120821 RepID=A0AAU7E0M1_9MICO
MGETSAEHYIAQRKRKPMALHRDAQIHGTVFAFADQPVSIGLLAAAVAQRLGIQVTYLPGLT